MAHRYNPSSHDSDSDKEFRYPTDSSESESEVPAQHRKTFQEYVESNPMVKNPQEASLLTEFLRILNEMADKDRASTNDAQRIGRERSMQEMMKQLEEHDKVGDMLSDLIKNLDKEIVVARKIVEVAEKSAQFQWGIPAASIPRAPDEPSEPVPQDGERQEADSQKFSHQ